MTNDFTPLPPTTFPPTEFPPTERQPTDNDIERNACAIIAVLMIILGLGGVGAWYFLTHDTVTPKTDPNIVSATTGGKIVSPYGVTIIIPAGALLKDKKIEVQRVAEGRVTDLFRLLPEGLKFLKPVIVEIPYKESGFKRGQTAKNIILEYWFTENERKQRLTYEADESVKKLRVKVKQF